MRPRLPAPGSLSAPEPGPVSSTLHQAKILGQQIHFRTARTRSRRLDELYLGETATRIPDELLKAWALKNLDQGVSSALQDLGRHIERQLGQVPAPGLIRRHRCRSMRAPYPKAPGPSAVPGEPPGFGQIPPARGNRPQRARPPRGSIVSISV